MLWGKGGWRQLLVEVLSGLGEVSERRKVGRRHVGRSGGTYVKQGNGEMMNRAYVARSLALKRHSTWMNRGITMAGRVVSRIVSVGGGAWAIHVMKERVVEREVRHRSVADNLMTMRWSEIAGVNESG